jgi:hypothetical protein
MRGRPWIRIALVALGIVVFAWPVWRLTRPVVRSEPVAAPSAVAPAAARNLVLDLTFAHAPVSFRVSYLGRTILSGGGKNEFSGSWTTALDPAGDDLLIEATWPPGTPKTAVEMKVSEDVDQLADKTFWADGPLTDILTVPPRAP